MIMHPTPLPTQTDSSSPLLTGIAPEHAVAAIAVLLLLPAIWLGLRFALVLDERGSARADRFLTNWEDADFARRTIALLLLASGVIHLALPIGHADSVPQVLAYLVSGLALVAMAFRSLGDGAWRKLAAVLLVANIVAYLVIAGSGWQEEPDQVGIATKFIELAALGLIVIPPLQAATGLRQRLRRPAATFGFVSLTVITGLVIWVGAFVAHDHSEYDAEAGEDDHSHEFAARAQAGILMRPLEDEDPTPEQEAAAEDLALDTLVHTTRYESYDVALADGYVPDGPELGLERHLKNEAYGKDGRILDPSRPELLVYASDGDRHVFLGVAYTMEKAGEPGPAIGGPLTRWHAHNVCVTLLPPAFGLVSPFGTCPVAAVAITLPEMMHVWTVENPDGPYAEHLDDDLVRELLAGSGPKD